MKQIPNIITAARIVLAPVIALLIIHIHHLNSDVATASSVSSLAWLAVGLFILACVSDWLDGYLARQMKVVSSIGRMLDPIADKLLVAGCLLALALDFGADYLFIIPALIILFRELLISGLREHLAGAEIVVPVSLLAKWKTAAQMTALGLLMAVPAQPDWSWVAPAGIAVLWISALMTSYTGWQYFTAAADHLRD